MHIRHHWSVRLSLLIRACVSRVDVRLLIALITVGGAASWLLPWQALYLFLPVAALGAFATAILMPGGRAALKTYGLFILFWSVSQLVLLLFERPGEFEEATMAAFILGGRLFALLGIAMAVPLAATPILLGRALTWYLGWLSRAEGFVINLPLFRGRLKPLLATGIWRAALALALMMAFFPRSFRTLSALRRSIGLRAPRLSLLRRVTLLGLAAIRILSSQTWDMTLAIASRDLYRPEPWQWRSARSA